MADTPLYWIEIAYTTFKIWGYNRAEFATPMFLWDPSSLPDNSKYYWDCIGWGWRIRNATDILVDWIYSGDKPRSISEAQDRVRLVLTPNGNWPQDIRDAVCADIREVDLPESLDEWLKSILKKSLR